MEGGYDRRMNVRIGIANTDKIIEIEVEDEKTFKKEIEKAVEEGSLGWFVDSKGRRVGIPARGIAFIVVEDEQAGHTVGFGPGS
jgi:hypothetical protein